MNKKERIILFHTAAIHFSHIVEFMIMISVGNHLMAFLQFGGPIVRRMADRLGKLKVYTIFVLASMLPVFLITDMSSMNYILVLTATVTSFLLSGRKAIPESHPTCRNVYYSNI